MGRPMRRREIEELATSIRGLLADPEAGLNGAAAQPGMGPCGPLDRCGPLRAKNDQSERSPGRPGPSGPRRGRRARRRQDRPGEPEHDRLRQASRSRREERDGSSSSSTPMWTPRRPPGDFWWMWSAPPPQFESRRIGERQKAVHAVRRSQGKRAGQAPLLPEAVRLRIAADRAAGRSLNAIAAALNHEGVPTAKGGVWHASTIRHVLQSIEVDADLAKVRSGSPA